MSVKDECASHVWGVDDGKDMGLISRLMCTAIKEDIKKHQDAHNVKRYELYQFIDECNSCRKKYVCEINDSLMSHYDTFEKMILLSKCIHYTEHVDEWD